LQAEGFRENCSEAVLVIQKRPEPELASCPHGFKKPAHGDIERRLGLGLVFLPGAFPAVQPEMNGDIPCAGGSGSLVRAAEVKPVLFSSMEQPDLPFWHHDEVPLTITVGTLLQLARPVIRVILRQALDGLAAL